MGCGIHTHSSRQDRTPVRAFTLVELLVAISIIVVLIAILVPAIGGARNSARRTATSSLMSSVANGINQFRSQNNRLPGYFSQQEIGRSDNNTGFTQMENALLDLVGGVIPAGTAFDNSQMYNFQFTMPGTTKEVRINTLQVGSSDGPQFLNLTAKGVGSNVPQSNGLAPARAGADQIQNPLIGADKFQMPDILDSWGKPLILWSRNEAPGTNPAPAFTLVNAPAAANAQQGIFYWQPQRGYVNSQFQNVNSALSETSSPEVRERTMAAVLGHPGFPDPSAPDDEPAPQSPRGDFVLHSAGLDGVYVNNGGNTATEYRYLPAGANETLLSTWATDSYSIMEKSDDIVQGGS